MRRSRRVLYVVSIAGVCLCLPLTCVSALLLFDLINPMRGAFITTFTVRNDSGQTVRITPIGTYRLEGRRGRLPMYLSTFPAIPAPQNGEFVLEADESREFRYDWDDVNFSEIAVCAADGELYELIVDPQPTKNQYHAPAQTLFAIPPMDQLRPATPDVQAATEAKHRSALWLWGVMAIGLLPPITLRRLWTAYRRPAPAVQLAVPPVVRAVTDGKP
ncbi:MAG: hypothetical protein JXA69_09295 [Phycisphaerae bacterium]|nr:hypothetical protein [Phycisphaerae bacterium]